ncbi:hypothetical protein HBI70_165580 [Parastagonospora nodorum]|nr:hypothetical protein HBI70_165580 [Parastagonospora nodorum]
MEKLVCDWMSAPAVGGTGSDIFSTTPTKTKTKRVCVYDPRRAHVVRPKTPPDGLDAQPQTKGLSHYLDLISTSSPPPPHAPNACMADKLQHLAQALAPSAYILPL